MAIAGDPGGEFHLPKSPELVALGRLHPSPIPLSFNGRMNGGVQFLCFKFDSLKCLFASQDSLIDSLQVSIKI